MQVGKTYYVFVDLRIQIQDWNIAHLVNDKFMLILRYIEFEDSLGYMKGWLKKQKQN